MGKNFKFYIYLALFLAETIVLLWFSFIPSFATVETDFMRGGDVEHFIAYLVYAFIFSRLMINLGHGKRKILLLPILAGFFVGTLCETIQLFVPTRVMDIIDVLVDTAGAMVGSWISLKSIDFKLWPNKNLLTRFKNN